MPEYHECGGCGRVNDVDDDVCLCDMQRFKRERPDEYNDLVRDGVIEVSYVSRVVAVARSAYWHRRRAIARALTGAA